MTVRLGLIAWSLVVLSSGSAGAWGKRGHELVNELAVEALPAGSLSETLSEDLRAVRLAGSMPDWSFRYEYPEVEPERHFYLMDAVASPPYEGLPLTREAIAACRLPPPRKVGFLPLAVREHYDELVRMLVAGDEEGTRREAGLLGHYVADATMPLHGTSNSEGWETGNDGIHRLLEVTFYEWAQDRIEELARAAVGEARVDCDPVGTTAALQREALNLMPDLLSLDDTAREAGGDLDGRSGEELGPAAPILASQLARAAEVLAGLWLCAEQQARLQSSGS